MLCCLTGVFTAAFDCGIEWLIVKGIADYADGSQLASESWSSCASLMAASLVAYVVVNFSSQVIFVFLLFWGMVMYANEVETKEK